MHVNHRDSIYFPLEKLNVLVCINLSVYECILRKIIPVLFFQLDMAVTCWPKKAQAQATGATCAAPTPPHAAVRPGHSSVFPGFLRREPGLGQVELTQPCFPVICLP